MNERVVADGLARAAEQYAGQGALGRPLWTVGERRCYHRVEGGTSVLTLAGGRPDLVVELVDVDDAALS